jgi:ribosome biogenesis GTPase / thiamine phosphate phosphatase
MEDSLRDMHEIGWDATRERGFAAWRERGMQPGRVAREDRGRYLLLVERGEVPAVPAGRLRHRARGTDEWPAVGDWVAAQVGAAVAIVHEVLPRAGAFTRKAAGRGAAVQVIAANVDVALLVSGLDGDFNPRRIERYVTAAWESGAEPVIVLNKADLPGPLEERTAEAASTAPGVPVLALSALTGDGLEALGPWLRPGRTVALLGSSGAGKSTLANRLLGHERQVTAPVRADDSRGRHTTTTRELIMLPTGALLLDTPGLRELQPWADEAGLAGAFPDIAALAERCRFRDCGHDAEPGCAVRAAADSGQLAPERLESWRRLRDEMRWLETRHDARARAEEERRWKTIHRSMKHHPKSHRWD